MTHVVEAQVVRFYKVYVNDDRNSMSTDQILDQAKELLLEGQGDCYLNIEEQDIQYLGCLYDLW